MKFVIYFLLLIGTPFSAFARDWTLEVRGAYYSPKAEDVREVYSSGWIDYQVLTSKRVANYWECWGQVSWAIKKGHTKRGYFGAKDSTKAWILPVSAGVRFIYPVACRTQVYFGAGGSYSFLKIDNHHKDFYDFSFIHSAFFKKRLRKSGAGALFKAGIIIDTYDNTFIDLFVDYFLQSFHLGHHDLFEDKVIKRHFKASGFKIGAGFGVNF